VSGPGEPRGYDAVRDALREKGYLETPLERLFLGTGRAPWQRIVLSALLAGLIAGPLLAAILAAVVVAGSRGLVPAWPDGVLYGVLFAPVLGVVVALWWALRSPGVAPGDLLALLALVLGAGITGRIVAAATLPEAIAAAGRTPRRRSRAFLLSVGLALVLAVVAAVVASLVPGHARGAAIALEDGAPSRLVVIGWDGIGLREMRGLLEREVPGAADVLGAGRVVPVDTGSSGPGCGACRERGPPWWGGASPPGPSRSSPASGPRWSARSGPACAGCRPCGSTRPTR